MSVLSCPVCQGAMQEQNKSGILIDVCTRCRGVWLDRGELEKLAAVVDRPAATSFLGGAAPLPVRHQRRRDDDDDDDRRGHGHQPRSKSSRFLDFFD